MSKLRVFAIVIGVFLVALVIGRFWNLKPESAYSHIVHKGETAILTAQFDNSIWAAPTPDLTYPLHSAMARGDATFLKDAETNSGAFVLPAGARVLVTGEQGSKRKFQVTSGPLTGSTGWVEFECLRPLARGER